MVDPCLWGEYMWSVFTPRKFEKCLEEYDTDNNGVLDKKEFAELLRGPGVSPTEARVREAFEMIDIDQSGTINYKEFKEWWTKDTVTYVLKRDGNFLSMTRQRSVWSEPVNLSGKRENMFFKFMIFSSH